ncbi:cyclic-phosphate processing receiver domain-containing protein [Kitasatospora sp. NPDC056531]|uniref:cyclic-phosphate processing receiver domain-containing protein n=1 Tax=Kitasatospora sp. NPDC056531 TaxID=3345856 RepID=UPI0036BAE80F
MAVAVTTDRTNGASAGTALRRTVTGRLGRLGGRPVPDRRPSTAVWPPQQDDHGVVTDRADEEAELVAAPAARPAESQYPVVIPPAYCDNDPVKEAPTSPMPVVLGIDDLRPLPRATRIARTSREGIQLLEEHRDRFIDELWLDHDLGGDDTIMPVVTLMEEAAFNGRPFRIGAVFVHSANPIGAETVVRSLARWSYRVQRATA